MESVHMYLVLLGLVTYSTAQIIKQCPSNGQQQTPHFFTDIIQVPNHYCTCTSKEQGTLRYRDEMLEICNGNEFVSVCEDKKAEVPKLGTTISNPADSCRQILEAESMALSGVYYIKTGNVTVRAYCMMETICKSAGWTLLMKMDGTKRTFHYDSALWTNQNEYNVTAVHDGLSGKSEIKLLTYSHLPFTELCLGFQTGDDLRWLPITMPQKRDSLYSVIAPGTFVPTSLGKEAWKSLVPNASLQPKCGIEGFNNKHGGYHNAARARIGILGNNEDDCLSADSRIGLGTGGRTCGTRDYSAGNEARCGGDNGDKSTTGMGYILAQ